MLGCLQISKLKITQPLLMKFDIGCVIFHLEICRQPNINYPYILDGVALFDPCS
jgi:hypothetical protein